MNNNRKFFLMIMFETVSLMAVNGFSEQIVMKISFQISLKTIMFTR